MTLPLWFLKYWKYGALAIALALLAIQTIRLDASQETAAARQITIEARNDRIKEDAVKLANRDALIARQNTAVDTMLADLAEAKRVSDARVATARQETVVAVREAEALMALQAPLGDEIELCRASADLLRQELAR